MSVGRSWGKVTARQDLGTKIGCPRRPDVVGVEWRRHIAGVLPCGDPAFPACGRLLVVLVLACVDEGACLVVVAEEIGVA